MKRLLTLCGAAIYQDPEKPGAAIYQDPEKPGMRVLLFITTAVFSILAIVSAYGLFILTLFFLAYHDLAVLAFWMIPVAFVAGQVACMARLSSEEKQPHRSWNVPFFFADSGLPHLLDMDNVTGHYNGDRRLQ